VVSISSRGKQRANIVAEKVLFSMIAFKVCEAENFLKRCGFNN